MRKAKIELYSAYLKETLSYAFKKARDFETLSHKNRLNLDLISLFLQQLR